MSSVRLRRLQADYEKLAAYAQRHPRVRLVQAEGQPPERYQVEFQLRSVRQTDEQLSYIDRHLVEISLPRNYPRMPPQCRMLTPVFHPNVAPHAICIGDHWNAGEPLWSMVMRIGEMLAYQSYNTKSPLNGEAARWVEENVASMPLDPVPMYVDQPDRKPAQPATAAPSGATAGAVPTAKVVRRVAPDSAGTPAAAAKAASPAPASPVPTARVVKRPSGAPAAQPGQALPASPVVAKPATPVTARPATPVTAKPATPVTARPATPVAAKPVTPVASPVQAAPKPAAAAPVQGASMIQCVCPGCKARYDVPSAMAGKNARCKKCRAVITIPSP